MDSTVEEVVEGASARLVAALATRDELPGLTVRTITGFPTGVRAGRLAERPIVVDQTNVSVIVDEQVVVKWLRLRNSARAPELLAHLVANGFTRTPAPYAAVFRDGALVAMVTAYLPDARDGWEWCVEAVLEQLEGGRPADFAPELGGLAAELHAALATPSPVLGSPVRHAVPATDGLATLGEAQAHALAAADEDGRWFAERVPLIAADISAGIDAANAGGPVPVIPIHGDLHVGQVLRWSGGYALIDFDGNPTTTSTSAPAVRDVAQLRTSLLHVAQIADRRSFGRHRSQLLEWAERGATAMLEAYRAGLAERGLSHLFDERLLHPYEVEQECRELVYAAQFLPRWRYAPMGVLRSWYP